MPRKRAPIPKKSQAVLGLLQDVRGALTSVIQGGKIRAKAVAKAIGKLVATEAALGPIVQLLSRAAQHELAQATEQSWKVRLQLTEQAR